MFSFRKKSSIFFKKVLFKKKLFCHKSTFRGVLGTVYFSCDGMSMPFSRSFRKNTVDTDRQCFVFGSVDMFRIKKNQKNFFLNMLEPILATFLSDLLKIPFLTILRSAFIIASI